MITDGRIAADRHCLTHLGLSGPGKVKISSQDPVKLLCSFLHTQEELHQLGGGTEQPGRQVAKPNAINLISWLI